MKDREATVWEVLIVLGIVGFLTFLILAGIDAIGKDEDTMSFTDSIAVGGAIYQPIQAMEFWDDHQFVLRVSWSNAVFDCHYTNAIDAAKMLVKQWTPLMRGEIERMVEEERKKK